MSEDLDSVDETPKKIDETIVGGRYLDTRGKLVNANGERIDADGNKLTQEEIDADNAAPPE